MTTPYYADTRHGIALYHGDARDVLPTLTAVDHVITDPPYESQAHSQMRRVKRGRVLALEPLPFAPMSEALRRDVAQEFGRLARRWVLTFCQVEAAPTWRAEYEGAGLVYRRTCIWVKPDAQPQLSGDRPAMGYETILAMHKGGGSLWNGGGRTSVFVVNKNENGGTPAPHPTTKPKALMMQLVALFSDPDETVLDPFAGSGTTLMAAKRLGRKAIGVEIEERWCEVAARRLEHTPPPLPGMAAVAASSAPSFWDLEDLEL